MSLTIIPNGSEISITSVIFNSIPPPNVQFMGVKPTYPRPRALFSSMICKEGVFTEPPRLSFSHANSNVKETVHLCNNCSFTADARGFSTKHKAS